MQNVQRIVLVDFGAQYTQLIARRVREAKVFCEVVSYLTPLSEILEKKPVGIILSGGPASVLDADAPHIDPAIYEQGIPVLGICYGMQLTAYTLGGTVERAAQREYGRIPVDFDVSSPLFAGTVPLYFLWKLIWRFQFTPASVYRMPCALRVLSAAAALLFAVVLIKVFLVPGLPCGHTLYAAGTGAYLLCTGLELPQTLFEAAHNMLTLPDLAAGLGIGLLGLCGLFCAWEACGEEME